MGRRARISLVSCLMLLGLAGCGGGDDGNGDTETTVRPSTLAIYDWEGQLVDPSGFPTESAAVNIRTGDEIVVRDENAPGGTRFYVIHNQPALTTVDIVDPQMKAPAPDARSERNLITSAAGRTSGGINNANLARGFGGGAGAIGTHTATQVQHGSGLDPNAGGWASRNEPAGILISTGRSRPALAGIDASVRILMAKKEAECVIGATALMLPRRCGDEPAKSRVSLSRLTSTLSSMTTGSSLLPSSSRRSCAR